MAKRKGSLDEFQPAAPTVRLVEDDRPSSKGKQSAPESEDLKLKSFRLPAETIKRLALLKVETGRTEQDLAAEAFALLFNKLES